VPRHSRLLSVALVAAATLAPTFVTVAFAPAASAAGVIDGPDVSSYQHPYGASINWSRVAASHREFAIVKATEGSFYVNPYFSTDYSRVRRVGMVRGSYHFARPAYPLVDTATRQAKYYVARLGASPKTSRTLPPALDLEVTGGLSRAALVTWAQNFLLTVRKLTGRTPMIYTYPSFWSSALGDPVAFQRYRLWMASYGSPVDDTATLWQYTSSAQVSGIHGRVDMSKLTAPTAHWSTLSDGRVASPWPTAAPTAPRAVRAEAAAGSAVVRWMPGDTGSSAIQRYRVTASPSGVSVVVGGARSSATVTGLPNGVPATFTVTAVNSVGRSPASRVTDTVTPRIPAAFSASVPSSVTYGNGGWLRARLHRPDTGAAIGARAVTLQTRPHGTRAWTTTRTLTTDDAGRVARWFRPGRSIDVRLHFDGPFGWASATTGRTLVVRSRIVAHLSRTRVHVNRAVRLYGHITPAVGGVRVYRESYYRGGWRVLATTVTSETGHYSFRFTPSSRGTRYYRTVVAGYGGRASGATGTLVLHVWR